MTGEHDVHEGDYDPEVLRLIEICHENAHNADHDIEDGILLSATRREVWLMTLAFLLLSQSAPCLEPNCSALTERIVELMDVQKPHWRSIRDDIS